MTDRTALVTGASRGIGRAIAERLAADGARVAVHGRDEVAAAETVARVEAAGGTAFPLVADLGTADGVDVLFDGLEARLAGAPLHVLVNNAAAPPAGGVAATTPDQLDHLLAVNVRAPYLAVRRALPLLPAGGRIVTVSSVAVRMANPTQTSFAMTKGAIETMTLTLASELGRRGITVNAVAPGATRTEANGAAFAGIEEQIVGLTALGRLGRADDVADVVAFLASDAARWVTGQVIDASGGLHLGPRIA